MHSGLIFHTGRWRVSSCMAKHAVLLRSVLLQLYLGTGLCVICYVALVGMKCAGIVLLIVSKRLRRQGLENPLFKHTNGTLRPTGGSRFLLLSAPCFVNRACRGFVWCGSSGSSSLPPSKLFVRFICSADCSLSNRPAAPRRHSVSVAFASLPPLLHLDSFLRCLLCLSVYFLL